MRQGRKSASAPRPMISAARSRSAAVTLTASGPIEELSGTGTVRVDGLVSHDVDVGGGLYTDELRKRHDAVVVAIGSRVHRELPVPGRSLAGSRPRS